MEKRRDSANGKEAAKTERRGDKERGREMGRKIANKKRKSPNEAKKPSRQTILYTLELAIFRKFLFTCNRYNH